MGKLATFIQNNVGTINTFKQDYISGSSVGLKRPLQEFFGGVQNLTGLMREYDLADIKERELQAKITADAYTNSFDKERDIVEKDFALSQKYLLGKEIDKQSNEVQGHANQINEIKGV